MLVEYKTKQDLPVILNSVPYCYSGLCFPYRVLTGTSHLRIAFSLFSKHASEIPQILIMRKLQT